MEYILFKKDRWSKPAIKKHFKVLKLKSVKSIYNNKDIVLYKVKKNSIKGGMKRAPQIAPNRINWANFPNYPVNQRQNMINHLIASNFELTDENVAYFIAWGF